MKPQIYYAVETLFYRKRIGNKLDFLIKGGDLKDAFCTTKSEFRDISPISAREKAFSYYQSFVDTLYDGLGKVYASDHQARIDLQYYLNSGNDIELICCNPNKCFKVSDDILNGLNLYMVIDNRHKKECKTLIHRIGYLNYPENIDEEIQFTLQGLVKEYRLFEKYSYPINNYKEVISLLNSSVKCNLLFLQI